MKTSFTVGDRHLVEITLPAWGPAVFSVDGQEVCRKRSLALKQVVQFDVGSGEERQRVEIRMNFWPMLKPWRSDNWIAEAYVDGELVIPDLTGELRIKVAKSEKVVDRILLAFVVIAVILWAWRLVN